MYQVVYETTFKSFITSPYPPILQKNYDSKGTSTDNSVTTLNKKIALKITQVNPNMNQQLIKAINKYSC